MVTKDYEATVLGILAMAKVIAKNRDQIRQRQLIEELLVNQPTRTSRSLHELSGASYKLIKSMREELDAPPRRRSRPPKSMQPHPHLNGGGHPITGNDQRRATASEAQA